MICGQNVGWMIVVVALVSCSQRGPQVPGNVAEGKTVAEGDTYRVVLTAPEAVRSGQPIETTIRLVPKAPYKVNMEYPVKLTVTAPPQVSPRELSLGKDEAAVYAPTEAVLKPRFRAAPAGEHRFEALFRFSVCTDEVCELEAKTVTWSATVKP